MAISPSLEDGNRAIQGGSMSRPHTSAGPLKSNAKFLLDRVGKPAVGDFNAHRVSDLLAAAQVFGFSAYVEPDLIPFVVFDRVDITLDVLECSADRLPSRAWLTA